MVGCFRLAGVKSGLRAGFFRGGIMGPDEAKQVQPELPTKQGFRFTDGTVMIKDLATGIYRNPANQRPALSKRERAKLKR